MLEVNSYCVLLMNYPWKLDSFPKPIHKNTFFSIDPIVLFYVHAFFNAHSTQNIYCKAGMFGSGKVWQIWQIVVLRQALTSQI